MATALKGHRRGRNITDAERAKLDKVDRAAREQGWVVLDSQWMKNPRLSHFSAPVFRSGEKGSKVGVIRVAMPTDDPYARPDVTILMPTDDYIEL